ncbi:NAD(P) transhydrogenase subunit alpha [Rodentibacter caecimuris]|uniref:NAD(P) transhydrogenase subunit alpha n=1 Tax=Rodentibacter caecimuris TaxID=1796644 RepID=A0A1V3KKJ8_9PAST|nr:MULTISPECIES: Re/Si-specific NAD(P)(+) transhydrogenase subunit alpha [Pasteurellaceae]OOF56443.1 NAD(P) transhydrogenase subunit alpha [Rodentibacter genomosp. 2]MCQ9122557.1 Re/Si-specific NAD(P)(+) transhydrogenase subunit alpha [Rodentibacter heylii]MCR1836438.1 Re/Si-specific NAD(P)(+) transhydrogenase subunit alpha [Pasteurella caecimuris]MCU0105812.1 Re/Si-specific NAD(P)(+) transhydrogenase subunit alpha [Pasteurella caecimuris]MCX2962001.1 Re/Si-specific NAD(P)(+) transhydrogenase 
MLIGVPKELLDNEARVAATPKTVQQILKLGFEVIVEHDAGFKASFEDQAFLDAGAKIGTAAEIWQSDIIFKVNPPTDEEIAQMKEGATLVSFIWRAQNPELMQKLTAKKINVLAMDAVPRISRAQALDALSSMANISGYRAVIEAAHEFGSFFTGQITAAGKVPPAKVLVIGAGVAGLAAIGAANSLGAIVRAFDSRPEVKEQVQSMGASFLEIDFKEEGGSGDGYAKVMSEEFNRRAMELYAEQAKEVDIIITTAAIPGKPAPRLITKEMVDSMKAGSVIVDLAAATGGNCEYTQAGKVVTTENQVKVIGYTDFPSRLPTQSSQLYGTNLVNLLKLLCKEKDGNINIDFEDVVLRGVTVVRDGEEIPPAQIQVSAQPKQDVKATPVAEKKEAKPTNPRVKYGVMAGVGVLFLWLASVAPAAFLSHFTVFVLACVVGYYVVWNVSHALHTPLMAVTNAISGIIIVGALLQIRQPSGNLFIDALAFVAILVASINIFGGFRVTQRMLAMFRKG